MRTTIPTRAAFLVTALAVLIVADGAGAQVGVGDRPDLSLQTLDGTPVSLSSLLGSVVLVDFWATWCDPCRESLPFYADLRERYGARGFEVVAASVDDRREDVAGFLAREALALSVVWDDDHEVVEAFAPPTMPTSYLIDRAGVVRFVHPGFGVEDRDQVEAELRALLDEPAPSIEPAPTVPSP